MPDLDSQPFVPQTYTSVQVREIVCLRGIARATNAYLLTLGNEPEKAQERLDKLVSLLAEWKQLSPLLYS